MDGIRTPIDISSLLNSLGITGQDLGRELIARCPNAAKHANGVDSNPSWRIVIEPSDPRYGQHFCHPCGFGGGPVRLVRHITGVDHQTALSQLGIYPGPTNSQEGIESRWLAWDLNPNMGVGTSALESPELQLPTGSIWITSHTQLPRSAIDYWEHKVGTKIDGRHGPVPWGIGYGVSGRLRDRIIMPVRTGGSLVGYSARSIDFRSLLRERVPGSWPDDGSNRLEWIDAIDRRLTRARGSRRRLLIDSRAWLEGLGAQWPGLRYLTPRERLGRKGQLPEIGARLGSGLMFWDRIFPPEPIEVTLVEGGIKAIRLAASGWTNPVAITGASGLTPARRSLLQTASRITVIVDPDPAGRRLAREVRDRVGSRLTKVEPIEFDAPVDRIPIRRLTELRKV